MVKTEMMLANLNTDPMWQLLEEELSFLLNDLANDQKHGKRVMRIRKLLAAPQFLKVEQIYFVPQTLTVNPHSH